MLGLGGSRSGRSGPGLSEDALVVAFIGGDHVVGAEFFLGVGSSKLAYFAAAVRA